MIGGAQADPTTKNAYLSLVSYGMGTYPQGAKWVPTTKGIQGWEECSDKALQAMDIGCKGGTRKPRAPRTEGTPERQ